MSTADEHEVLAGALARMRSAVEAVAAGELDPTAPTRGLYVDDAEALRLGAGKPERELEERFDAACARLELDPLERQVLALCMAPETHPDAARLFGYLHDDLTRCHASPRLVARLIAGDAGEVAVLKCFGERSSLRVTGAVRVDAAGPLGDRAVTIGAQLACQVLGADIADATAAGRLRRHDGTPLPVGREPTVRRLRVLLGEDRELPLAIQGPDALDLLVAASGRSLVVLDARSALEPECSADLALAAALGGHLAVVDAIGELEPDGRQRALARIVALPCRPVLHVDGREDSAVLAEQGVIGVDVPPLTTTERAKAWRKATGCADVGAVADRFRLDLRQIHEAAVLARAEADVREASGAGTGLAPASQRLRTGFAPASHRLRRHRQAQAGTGRHRQARVRSYWRTRHAASRRAA